MDIGDDDEQGDDEKKNNHRRRRKKDEKDEEDKSKENEKNDQNDLDKDASKNAEENADQRINDKKQNEENMRKAEDGSGSNTRDMNSAAKGPEAKPETNDIPNTPSSSGDVYTPPSSASTGAPEAGTAGASTVGPEAGAVGAETGTAGTATEAGAAGAEAGTAGTSTVAAEAGGAASAAEAGAAGATAAEGAGAAAGAAGTAGAAAGAAEAAGGAAAAAGGVSAAAVAGIVLVIIAIALIIIGILAFFVTAPQFFFNRLKEIATNLWDGVQGYLIGLDDALVNKDDVIDTAQYLYDMGYDLVGMGFAESVTIYGQPDEDGNMVEVAEGHVKNEIKSVDAPYLRAYLVAENRTYLVNNYTFNLKSFGSSFFDGTFWENGSDAWGTGLIDLDDGFLSAFNMIFDSLPVVGQLTQTVKIDRSANTMQIKRLNIGWKFWKAHNDYTYFNLEGWSGRYGKPFELLLTMHVATMSPDLVKEFAMNKDLDAKVHVKLRDTSFGGTVHINGTSINDLQEVEHTHTDENGKEVVDYVDYTDGAKSYSVETVEGLRKIQKDRAEDVKTSIPYISSVTNHWFRNVYFEGEDSTGASGSTEIGIDTDDDGLENYKEKSGVKTQESTTLSSGKYNAYNFGDDIEATLDYLDDDISETVPGLGADDKITLVGTMEDGVVQVRDAVRGLTNQTTKELFSKKYYIYDGTISKAKEIQRARKAGDNSIKEKVQFTKNSLQAFTILEETETLDAQYIYRDLKELVIELGYFEKEDFYEIEKRVLEWPIPDYVPAEWPNKKVEKNVLEYGTLIACDETMANSLGISLADLRKMTQTDDEDDEDKDKDDEDNDYESTLNNCTFIGDEYFIGLRDNTNLKSENFYVKEGATPQYWINNIASLPSEPKTIIIYLGLNDLDDYKAAENLIDALLKKYENVRIYMLELLHLDKGFAKADYANKRIDTFNSHLREKCKVTKRTKFLNVSTGLVSAGYMINSDGSGTILANSEYGKFAENIYYGIRNKRDVSSNPTDEEFVAKLMDEAKDLSKYLKDNKFEYGTPEFIPAKQDGTTTEDGKKVISSDRYISWALYKAGCTDQPEEGLCVGKDGTFIEYCESKEWTRIDSIDSVQAGDIVFTGKIDDEGMKAQNVFICAGEGQRYECTSQDQINNGDQQPVKKDIGSDFVCAYRVTGEGVINTGFKEGLDVTAMGNGRITEIFDDNNNIFSDEELAKRIYGSSSNSQNTEDTVEGREQTLQGFRIKLTDTALKGYVLVMYGFELSGNLSVGTEIHTGDVIGKTLNSDICLILIDRDKAVIEDIENYMKIPKKTKTKRNEVDWDFYYWLPYESGALGEAGVPTGNGPGACGTVSGPSEIAVGIAQWTVYGSTNNIAPLCKWLAEEDPSLCGSLKAFGSYSSGQFVGDFGSLKAAWDSVNKKDTDRFLELQMQYFYDVDFTGWVKAAGVDWLLDKDLVTQGTYASLKNWGPNLGWESVMDASMSDIEIVRNLLTKALPIGSTCGTLETRWNSQYVLARDILDGTFTEVENWIRTEQPDKYSTGKNPGALGVIKMYFRILGDIYVADIKRTFLGGIYG